VIGGDRDAFYSAELFRQTVEGIPRADLALYSGRGHMSTGLDPRFLPDILSFLDPPDDTGSAAGQGEPGAGRE
jgi:hypothetical protein